MFEAILCLFMVVMFLLLSFVVILCLELFVSIYGCHVSVIGHFLSLPDHFSNVCSHFVSVVVMYLFRSLVVILSLFFGNFFSNVCGHFVSFLHFVSLGGCHVSFIGFFPSLCGNLSNLCSYFVYLWLSRLTYWSVLTLCDHFVSLPDDFSNVLCLLTEVCKF